MKHPVIIQGGMGAAVSSWRLANAVAREGQLGVVSGTALDVIMARRLQHGDPGGHVRRALSHFPEPRIAESILRDYFVDGGIPARQAYRNLPKFSLPIVQSLVELTVAANFVEIFLAREGHDGVVGMNYLEKIQMPNLPSLFGAMLAGVHYVLMGAGIPREIPGIIDRLARYEPVSLTLHVEGAGEGDDWAVHLDPKEILTGELPPLVRPNFLAVVASNSLAATLARKASGRVDGFVVEGPTAGGHNAPPRGALQVDEAGEPLYGPRDQVDLAKIAELGLPFWLAGSYGSREKLQEALSSGATGVQVGTAFALCRESGLDPTLRHTLIEQVRKGQAQVKTDTLASPTGFPFKVACLDDSLSNPERSTRRKRLCDLGYLRRAYRREDGSLGFRCPAEPIAAFLKKGGRVEETEGRKCLCNALLANIGMPQFRSAEEGYELALVTAGNDLTQANRFFREGQDEYTAVDVIRSLLGQPLQPETTAQTAGGHAQTAGDQKVPAAEV